MSSFVPEPTTPRAIKRWKSFKPTTITLPSQQQLSIDFKKQHIQYFTEPKNISSLVPLDRAGSQGDKFQGIYQDDRTVPVPVFVKRRKWNAPKSRKATSSQEIHFNELVRNHTDKQKEAKYFVHFVGWTWFADAQAHPDLPTDSVLLIFEWIEKSWAQKERDLVEDKKRLFDVVHGLAILHESLHVIHGDIKPSNVMIREDGTAAICDFGCTYNEACISCSTLTYHYPGEEVVFSVMTDLYSVGLILLLRIHCNQKQRPSIPTSLPITNKESEAERYDSLINAVTEQLRTCLVKHDEVVYTLLGRPNREFIPRQTLITREDHLKLFLNTKTNLTSALEAYLRKKFGSDR